MITNIPLCFLGKPEMNPLSITVGGRAPPKASPSPTLHRLRCKHNTKLHKQLNTQLNGLGYVKCMHYTQNIHNKNQTSTIKLFLPSHTTALNTALHASMHKACV